ncbi:MAG TPA: FdhF/YdeP family oxidoreductase [Thermoanaerobaculia bacterium]|nr:FdhF/YdeP family oxidoreductase [Thermoanaerobaculia bacterium]
MARPGYSAGGGLPAVLYVLRLALQVGPFKLWKRSRSRNACKTCAVGMGGQRGGMVNEEGHFPEICKKSVQAQAADMAGAISEEFFRTTPISTLERLTSAEFEKLGRLTFPIMATGGDSHFRRISWDEAYERAADAFRGAKPEETFFYSSGRASNEAAYLMMLVARAYGTANINNCSYYCHQASGVALSHVYGSGTASITLDDLREADVALVAGANPASNHPRLITQLVDLRKRGGKVIVVNPLRELGLVRFRIPSKVGSMLFGSTVSDVYLQPHIGGDIALYKMLLKELVQRGAIDEQFIAAHTAGWDDVRRDLDAASWESLSAACGLSRADIAEAVEILAAGKRGIFLWAMGLTHHTFGTDNILALSNLALARGWLGRRGAGLLPIRGHSNVQGVGSMGVAPELRTAFRERFESLYGIASKGGGFDTYQSMAAALDGRIKAALLLGGNLFASNPDRDWAGRSLRNIPMTFSMTTKLNEGHVHGRGGTAIIVPVLARDEEAQATTQESMFNFVRLSDGGLPSMPGEFRSEVEVLASLAERILPPGRFDWRRLRSHAALREEIARVVPGFEAMGGIDRSKEEFQIGGRTFHEAKFKTADGKAHFAVTALPDSAPAPGGFKLMTIRSEGQFNTVVYDEDDVYRGAKSRDVVLISQADADALGVVEDEKVVVKSEAGQMTARISIAEIRPRNLAMYYPEANALVPRRLDPRSKTPAFKSVEVRLERM